MPSLHTPGVGQGGGPNPPHGSRPEGGIMADQTAAERLDDVMQSVEAATKLAEDSDAFLRTFDAFQAGDAERFQSELSRAGLLPECRRICQWFCSKHCIFVCGKLAGHVESEGEL